MRPNLLGSESPARNQDVGTKKSVFADSPSTRYLAAPKRSFNLVFLLVLLLIPYMIFVQHYAFRLPQDALPSWFPIVAAGYFFGTLTLVTVLHKRRSRLR